MANEENGQIKDKSRFKFCPQCGRKGLYHIRQKYYRCRYCGTYLISPTEKKEA